MLLPINRVTEITELLHWYVVKKNDVNKQIKQVGYKNNNRTVRKTTILLVHIFGYKGKSIKTWRPQFPLSIDLEVPGIPSHLSLLHLYDTLVTESAHWLHLWCCYVERIILKGRVADAMIVAIELFTLTS